MIDYKRKVLLKVHYIGTFYFFEVIITIVKNQVKMLCKINIWLNMYIDDEIF